MTSLLVAMRSITKSVLIADFHALYNEVPLGCRLAAILSITKSGLIPDFHTLYNEVPFGYRLAAMLYNDVPFGCYALSNKVRFDS